MPINFATITYYAADTTMGIASADECDAYREWAQAQIQSAYPGYDVEVSAEESLKSVDTSDEAREQEITDYCRQLWDRCEWDDLKMHMEPNSGSVAPWWQWKAESAGWEGDIQAQLDSLIEVIDIGGVWVDNAINPARLQDVVECVEANNEQNSGNWSDWGDASDILDTYADGKGCDWVRHILDRAIESNGETLAEDLPKVERIVWGQNFSGSFWDRS